MVESRSMIGTIASRNAEPDSQGPDIQEHWFRG
jgi:hypothetical protein